MRIVESDGLVAQCIGDNGRSEQVSLALTGPMAAGTYVLVYLGSAVRGLEAEEAQQIQEALQAVHAARQGQPFEHLIADLIDKEPELPAHLRGS